MKRVALDNDMENLYLLLTESLNNRVILCKTLSVIYYKKWQVA